jgi:hypothetical protein
MVDISCAITPRHNDFREGGLTPVQTRVCLFRPGPHHDWAPAGIRPRLVAISHSGWKTSHRPSRRSAGRPKYACASVADTARLSGEADQPSGGGARPGTGRQHLGTCPRRAHRVLNSAGRDTQPIGRDGLTGVRLRAAWTDVYQGVHLGGTLEICLDWHIVDER